MRRRALLVLRAYVVCYCEQEMLLVRRLSALFVSSLLMSCPNMGDSLWPGPSGRVADDSVVRKLPLCVASESWSAGELGRTVLYRYKREGRTLTVGYFVYWTTERPWGKNLLSYSVLPALFIDAF